MYILRESLLWLREWDKVMDRGKNFSGDVCDSLEMGTGREGKLHKVFSFRAGEKTEALDLEKI